MSILKKMLLVLILTFMLPLLISGVLLTRYIGSLQAREDIRRDVEVLGRVSAELSQVFQTAEWFSGSFVARGLMWQFAGGMARPRDYLELAQMYNDSIRLVPAFESLVLIQNRRVVFERGPALDSDIFPFPGDIEETLRSEQDRLWMSPRKLNFFFQGKNGEATLPYYQGFYYSLSESPLLLLIGLSEQELYAHYGAYSRGPAFLVRDDGVILSASDKTLLGNRYPSEFFSRFTGTSGFFRSNDGTVILYTGGYKDWRLVNHVPGEYYYSNRGGPYVILLLAALLGLCFAGTYLLIQRRFIFKPLWNMLDEMNQFREGNLLPRMSYQSRDEIGRINHEVEQVFKRVNDLIHELYLSKIYNQEATLKFLTSQMNPHFLYNTLDSIHWKAVQNKDYAVSDQLEALSDLLRHMLSRGNDMVTLEQEMNQLENYLSIMKFRYGDRLGCGIAVDDELRELLIPKLILQPLVENAIVHGLDQRVEDGRIDVEIKKAGGLLRIRVSDNGVGADAEAINRMLQDKEVSHNVFALNNINRRIKLRYGEAYGVRFESALGKGALVTITIPLEGSRETAHIG
jgi:two-component system sensor histidine kinase YesM